MNIDVRNLHILVVAHKVDGLRYLGQFACVLKEISHNIRLVDTETEVSLTLLGTLLACLGSRLYKGNVRHPSSNIVDSCNLEIVEILPVSTSADVLSGKQTQVFGPKRALACNGLAVANALLSSVLALYHQRLLRFISHCSQFAATLHAYLFGPAINYNRCKSSSVAVGSKHRSENKLLFGLKLQVV